MVVWQSQDTTASGLWSYIFTQTTGENWMYAVKNAQVEAKVLRTLEVYGKNVGSPDVTIQGLVFENNGSTIKATSSNTLSSSDFDTTGKYATFNFSDVTVNTDEYIGWRATNTGTDIESNYISFARSSTTLSTQEYADYPTTSLGPNFYQLTWKAASGAVAATGTRLPPPPIVLSGF